MPVPSTGSGQSYELKPDDIAQIRRLISQSRDVLERYAREAEDKRGLYDLFREFVRLQKKANDELDERQARIERLLLLERTGNSNTAEAREIKSEITQEATNVEWLLQRHINNLNYLELQAATYGSGRAPLEIVNQIADEQEEIQRLQRLREKLNNVRREG